MNNEGIYEHTIEFSAQIPAINQELINKLAGSQNWNSGTGFTIQYKVFIQARKHRKKRINKKWLKRYGCKEVIKEMKNLKIENCGGGSFTFVREIDDND